MTENFSESFCGGKQFCQGKLYELIQIRNLDQKSQQKKRKLTFPNISTFVVGQESQECPMKFKPP